MSDVRRPPDDLLEDLRNSWDEELGDAENVCSASNAQLRLYVGGWMLGDVRAALELYERSGTDLLNRAGRLTTQGIAAEIFSLLA